jgi:hypothetical protein
LFLYKFVICRSEETEYRFFNEICSAAVKQPQAGIVGIYACFAFDNAHSIWYLEE